MEVVDSGSKNMEIAVMRFKKPVEVCMCSVCIVHLYSMYRYVYVLLIVYCIECY